MSFLEWSIRSNFRDCCKCGVCVLIRFHCLIPSILDRCVARSRAAHRFGKVEAMAHGGPPLHRDAARKRDG